MTERLKSTDKHYPFWDNGGLPIAIAHRGGDEAGLEKENTMAAFQAAYDFGYRYFEVDAIPTKNGQLVAIHGTRLQPRPNGHPPSRAKVLSMSLEQVLHKVDVGGEQPALVEDLLTSFPQARWVIDPKTDASAEPLIKLLKRHVVDDDRISLGAFSRRRAVEVAGALKEARRRDISISVPEFGATALRRCVQFGWRQQSARDYIARNQFSNISVPYKWLTEPKRNSDNIVDLAHEMGLSVVTWTPNNETNIEKSLDRGVDAIMSDSLGALKSAVLARGTPNHSIVVESPAIKTETY